MFSFYPNSTFTRTSYYQKAVYADSKLNSIMTTSLSESSGKLHEVYHYGNTAISDVAVDWVSDNIYWTNQTSHGRFSIFNQR